METKTVILQTIYEVRRSGKGWRETDAMFFDKEKALSYAKAKQETSRWNYRVYEWQTTDLLIYKEICDTCTTK